MLYLGLIAWAQLTIDSSIELDFKCDDSALDRSDRWVGLAGRTFDAIEGSRCGPWDRRCRLHDWG